MPLCRAAACCLLLCAVAPASAHFPGVFGRDFTLHRAADSALQVPHPPPPPTAEAMPDRSASSSADAAEHTLARALLEERERREGPYGAGLTDPLLLLARQLQARGDYRAAGALYQRALHVTRVNHGLTDLAQLPLLRALAAVYRETDDQPALERVQRGIYRSGRAALDSGAVDEGRAAVLEYLRWQRLAHGRRGAPDRARLVRLYDDTDELLQRLPQIQDPDQAWHRTLVMEQLHNLYLIMGELPAAQQAAPTGLERPPGSVTYGHPEYLHQRLTDLQRMGLSRGRRLLQDYLAAWPEMALLEQATVQRELGDWLQWNEKLDSAAARYREALSLLQAAGQESTASRWFDEPVELPAGGPFVPRDQSDKGQPPVLVTASYRVSPRGNVSDIEVSASQQAGRLRRMLRETHFRPSLSPTGERREARVRRVYRLYR